MNKTCGMTLLLLPCEDKNLSNFEKYVEDYYRSLGYYVHKNNPHKISSIGSPDFLVVKGDTAFYVEVKKTGDGLGENQLFWLLDHIESNSSLDFVLVYPSPKQLTEVTGTVTLTEHLRITEEIKNTENEITKKANHIQIQYETVTNKIDHLEYIADDLLNNVLPLYQQLTSPYSEYARTRARRKRERLDAKKEETQQK